MAFVTCTFAGSNSTNLDAHTPEGLGDTWTRHGSYSGSMQIQTNRIVCIAANAGYYASGVPSSAEYSVQATVRRVSGTGNIGPTARMSTSADTMYRVLVDGTNVVLAKRVAGSSTTLGSWAHGLSDGGEIVVKLECLDATKKVYVDGVERISSADNAITGAGRAGVVSFGIGTSSTGLHLDDFSATDAGLVAPDPPTGLTALPGDAGVDLSWTAPAGDGGSAITDYLIEYSLAGAGSWSTFADGTSTATTATVTGLTNGLLYDFRVSAVNAIGTGTPSATTAELAGGARDTWPQLGGNARRTSASVVTPSTPWRWLWSDGVDADGGSDAWRGPVPKEAFPVCGNGMLMMPRGAEGVWAWTLSTGDLAWQFQFQAGPGEFVASGAYDSVSDTFIVGCTDGRLYKFPSATGGLVTGVWSGVKSVVVGAPIRKAVLMHPTGRYAYVTAEDGSLTKVDCGTTAGAAMSVVARYQHASTAAGVRAETPATFSTNGGSTGAAKLIYCTSDGYVHAIRDSALTSGTITSGGAGGWRVAPHALTWGFPNTWDFGWPVVAERHGIVLVRCQLSHASQNAGPVAGRFPSDDAIPAAATIRTWFGTRASPGAGAAYRNLFAIDLTDGAEAFVPAVGYGAVESWVNNAPYGHLSSLPAIRIVGSDEVAYVVFRNGDNASPDYRWDGNLGEMALADDDPVATMIAGDIRFVRAGNAFAGGTGHVKVIDEQGPLVLAGTAIFHCHWAGTEGVMVTDRGDTKGLTFADPITTTDLPTVILSKTNAGTKNAATRYITDNAVGAQSHTYETPAFWVYWGIGDAPPGTPTTAAWSSGQAPRISFVHQQYLIVVGQGGDLSVFRHSGSVGGVSAPASPTGIEISAETTEGRVGVGVDVTYRFNGDSILPSGTVVVTPTDGAGSGTFSPTTLSLTQTNPGGVAVYTPNAADAGGTVDLTCTNNGGLANP